MSPFDLLFVLSAVAFNLCVVGVYLSEKFGRAKLLRLFGIMTIVLALPFAIVLLAYLTEGKELWKLAFLGVTLIYLFLEWLLDFKLKVDFRTAWITHAPYIVLFYIVLAGLIRIAFSIDRAWGWAVSITFWMLLAALVFSLVGRKKRAG